MQQVSKQWFHVTHLLTNFPRCFSIQASLNVMGLSHILRPRLVCCVTYDQKIDFMVKGPLGVEIISGVIDKKGITIVDHSRRVVHQWDYKQIKKDYCFVCSYAFIQSLLLGRVCSPIEDSVSTLDPLPFDLSYTYDEFKKNVVAIQLIDREKGNTVRILYQYKMVKGNVCLSGIRLDCSLRDHRQPYKGSATLRSFRFKKIKKTNLKLRIPAYYRQEIDVCSAPTILLP